MSLSLSLCHSLKNEDVNKKLFKLKPARRDGLLLNILYSNRKRKIRFVHAVFNNTGHILASADNDGHIFMVDFNNGKHWSLPKLGSCSVLKFCNIIDSDLHVGLRDGAVSILDYHTGHCREQLRGHTDCVISISYTDEGICLTASKNEAILWDLKTNNKIQVLTLEANCTLKFAMLMPLSKNILACFNDDSIQIWRYETYESVKHLSACYWSNYCVRNVLLSSDGRAMIVAGYVPKLSVFLIDSWKLLKLISLPDHVLSVRHIACVPNSFDKECNKMVAVLSGHGVLHFYDIEKNVIVSELTTTCEIIKFTFSSHARYLGCILSNGEVEIYDFNQYVEPPVEIKAEKLNSKVRLRKGTSGVKMEEVKSQINEVLDINKLKSILKEYGEYPSAYRLKIWEKLLALPNNVKQYNSIINHVTIVSFEDLYKRYPLESTTTVKSLKKLLNNLVTWCPFFAHVDYLPYLTFPFVKVFQNKPIMCFEAICSILLNWCQHWFEYFPLPPVNVLGMIENLLMEHDPELLNFYTAHNITPNIYAWPFLETSFSEILTTTEWLQFWDHVLTNEPSFLLCAVVSYSINQRNTIFTINTEEQFQSFFHSQNPNDSKKFIHKTYYILNGTTERMHPRQYLNMNEKMEVGRYPQFFDYPKTIVDFEAKERMYFNRAKSELENHEINMLKSKAEKWEKIKETEMEDVENERLRDMEKACMQRLLTEQEQVKKQHDRLSNLRRQLLDEEEKIFKATNKKLSEMNTKKRENNYEFLMGNIELGALANEHRMNKVEDELLVRYSELLKHKYRIKNLMLAEDVLSNTQIEHLALMSQQNKLAEEIGKVRKMIRSPEDLKKLNVATGIATMESLITKVELELANELAQRNMHLGEEVADKRVTKLQAECKELEQEIAKLLSVISNKEMNVTSSKINSEKLISRLFPNIGRPIIKSKTASSLSDNKCICGSTKCVICIKKTTKTEENRQYQTSSCVFHVPNNTSRSSSAQNKNNRRSCSSSCKNVRFCNTSDT